MIGGINMKDRDVLYECMGCSGMNVFPEHKQDGATCMRCGAGLIARNHVMVYRESSKKTKLNDIAVNVKVDTTEIDKALEKMKELLGHTDALNKRVGKDSNLTGYSQGLSEGTMGMDHLCMSGPENNITINISNNSDKTQIDQIVKSMERQLMRKNIKLNSI